MSETESGARRVGGFETLFELGSGGMGTAVLARAVGPGGFERLVVVKRMHPELLRRSDAVARFLDEARLAACIRHANVVSTQHVGHDEEGYFLVLEYVEGASLEELLDRAALKSEPIPVPIVLRIALDACAGLHAAHHARDTAGRPLELLHRDISLQNLLVGRDGMTRVVDFGVAQSALGSVTTGEGMVLGKILYLPPEYLRREPIGPELDVYGLGVTLWITLAGRDPWPAADDSQVVAMILGEGIPPLREAVEVAPQVATLVDTACHRERGARFSSARAMADRIEAIGRETGWLASHAEVADYVERLAGTDLERRREVVSRREHDLGLDSAPSGSGGTPAIPLSVERPRRLVGSDVATVAAVAPAPPRRVLWPLWLALATVSAIGGAVAVRASARNEEPAPLPAESAVAATTASAAPVTEAGSEVAPAPSEELVRTVASSTPRERAPVRGPSAREKPRAASSSAPPAPAISAKSAEPAPPTPTNGEISTKNPYREP